MPKLGEYAPLELPPGARRELAQAMRGYCGVLRAEKASLAWIANRLMETKSSVSQWINGHRIPHQAVLEKIHELAERAATDAGQLRLSREELLRLREQALTEAKGSPACEHCGGSSEVGSAPDVAIEPAPLPVLPTSRNSILPVPRALGDRQDEWSGFADLQARLGADQFADAAGILRHVGRNGDPAETAAAIAACQRTGLLDEVDSILVYAAQRADREVLSTIGGLLDRGCVVAAQDLVTLTLAGK